VTVPDGWNRTTPAGLDVTREADAQIAALLARCLLMLAEALVADHL
jgi:hypothetical protein